MLLSIFASLGPDPDSNEQKMMQLKEIHQTVLALRGSHGVGIEAAMAGGWIRSWTRPLIFAAIYSTW